VGIPDAEPESWLRCPSRSAQPSFDEAHCANAQDELSAYKIPNGSSPCPAPKCAAVQRQVDNRQLKSCSCLTHRQLVDIAPLRTREADGDRSTVPISYRELETTTRDLAAAFVERASIRNRVGLVCELHRWIQGPR